MITKEKEEEHGSSGLEEENQSKGNTESNCCAPS